jgi:hypothetical protein
MGGGERRPSTAGGGEYEPREPKGEADDYGDSGEREDDSEGAANGDKADAGGAGSGAGDGETTQQTLRAYGGGLPGGLNPVHDDIPGDPDVGEAAEKAGEAAAWWGLLGVVQNVSEMDDETVLDDIAIEVLQRVHDETIEE